MDNQLTIETLRHLASLLTAREELTSLVSYKANDQTTQKLRAIRNKFFDGEAIRRPSLASYSLNIIKEEESTKTPPFSYSTYAYCTLGVALATIAFLPQIIGWTGYFIVLIGAIALMLVLISKKKNEIESEKKRKLEKEYEPVQQAIKVYEQQAQQGVQQLEKQKTLYIKAFTECLEEIEAAEKRKAETQEQINDYSKEIGAIDLIAPKYYYLIDNIIDLLETGRADNYKEALNMALSQEEERKHRQAIEDKLQQELDRAAEQKQLALKQCEKCYYQNYCEHKGTINCTRFRPLW